jgi:hypothetical protein
VTSSDRRPADPVGEYSMTIDELANWIAGRGYSSDSDTAH